MIRLLYIIWDGILGGAAGNLADFVRNAEHEQYEVTVALLNRSGPAIEALRFPNLHAVEFGAKSGLDLKAFFRFLRFLHSNRFDIVHNNSITYFSHIALALAIAKKTALLYQEHGDVHTQGEDKKSRISYRLFQHVYDKFLTVSEYTAGVMEAAGVSRSRIIDVGNPIDFQYFRPSVTKIQAKEMIGIPTANPIIGTACRLVRQKDLPLFLTSAREINKAIPDARFAIVGSGSEEKALKQLAKGLGISDVVFFLGTRTDMPIVFRAFDICLFTSFKESFGRTILECLAAETPIVSVMPETGGSRQILEQAQGVVCTFERSSNVLAQLAIALIKDADRRFLLGVSGRQWVLGESQYHVRKWLERLGEAYLQALTNVSKRKRLLGRIRWGG